MVVPISVEVDASSEDMDAALSTGAVHQLATVECVLRKRAEQVEKSLHTALVGGREAIGSEALENRIRVRVRSANDERLFRLRTLPFQRSMFVHTQYTRSIEITKAKLIILTANY